MDIEFTKAIFENTIVSIVGKDGSFYSWTLCTQAAQKHYAVFYLHETGKMSVSEVPAVADYDFLLATTLENFMIACRPVGEPLVTMSLKVKEAFLVTKQVMIYALENPEPSQDGTLPAIMIRYVEAISNVVEFKNLSKDNMLENHLSTVREAIVGLGFINVKPTPAPFIKDMIDASQYYANRVLSQNKGENFLCLNRFRQLLLERNWVEKHMLFVTKHLELFNDLYQFVKKHYLTGFLWNSLPKSLRGSVVIPPPPPMQPLTEKTIDTYQSGDGARVALLHDLNQGSNITRNLKPVNRGGATFQPVRRDFFQGSTIVATGKPPQTVPPPKFCLEGKKWLVEYQNRNHKIVVESNDMSESVSIYKTDNCSIIIKNKINNLVIDNCFKTAINLSSVISSVELIRCERVRIKIDGVVPLINLESCGSTQIFLCPKSRDVVIVSSKSSSSNVCLMEDDGHYRELPMPEQIQTVVAGEKLLNSVIEKY